MRTTITVVLLVVFGTATATSAVDPEQRKAAIAERAKKEREAKAAKKGKSSPASATAGAPAGEPPVIEIWNEETTGTQWHEHRGRTTEQIELYFGVKDGEAQPLRIKIQFFAANPIFTQSYTWRVGDKTFSFVPERVEQKPSAGVYEWADTPVTAELAEMIAAAIERGDCVFTVVGRDLKQDRIMQAAELGRMKAILADYKAAGGKLPKSQRQRSKQFLSRRIRQRSATRPY
jgi:hypothetical protein